MIWSSLVFQLSTCDAGICGSFSDTFDNWGLVIVEGLLKLRYF